MEDATWTHYTFDPQGNVVHKLSASEAITAGRLLDAWGTGVETTLPRNIDPYGYNAKWGYYYDRETALYLCQRRMYDASAGRWITRDPIGYAGGMNLYGYCGGGPVGWADPRGLDAMDDFLRWGSNFFGGWGDALTFGGTDLVRDAMGTNEYVDKDSGWYAGGNAVGTIHGTAIMPATAAPEGTVLLFTNGGRKGAHAANQVARKMREQNSSESDIVGDCLSAGMRSAPPSRGRPPIGRDGYPMELHHPGQVPGQVQPMTRTDHRIGNNFKANHTNTGSSPSKIDRLQFSKERRRFWNRLWDSLKDMP